MNMMLNIFLPVFGLSRICVKCKSSSSWGWNNGFFACFDCWCVIWGRCMIGVLRSCSSSLSPFVALYKLLWKRFARCVYLCPWSRRSPGVQILSRASSISLLCNSAVVSIFRDCKSNKRHVVKDSSRRHGAWGWSDRDTRMNNKFDNAPSATHSITIIIG